MDVSDIVERDNDEAPQAPMPPMAPKAPSAFKREWKRKPKPSTASAASNQPPPAKPTVAGTFQKEYPSDEKLTEAEEIHLENLAKLAKMSPEEIAAEKQDIMDGMDEKVLMALMKRAKLKDEAFAAAPSASGGDTGSVVASDSPSIEKSPVLQKVESKEEPKKEPKEEPKVKKQPKEEPRAENTSQGSLGTDLESSLGAKEVRPSDMKAEYEVEDEDDSKSTPSTHTTPKKEPKKESKTATASEMHFESSEPKKVKFDANEHVKEDSSETNEPSGHGHRNAVHFPKPPTCEADESEPLSIDDEDFMEKLHEKYYPDLPKEPSKLAWMTDSRHRVVEERGADGEMTAKIIHDTSEAPLPSSLLPSEIRFDFKGNIITPKTSRNIPMNLGLHHHGESPDQAGYTILELAQLARSSIAGQRCIAIRTLGRILYRLGNSATMEKEYGKDIGMGIRGLIDQGRVIESITEATQDRHMNVAAYATEALWLWKQGGSDTRQAS